MYQTHCNKAYLVFLFSESNKFFIVMLFTVTGISFNYTIMVIVIKSSVPGKPRTRLMVGANRLPPHNWRHLALGMGDPEKTKQSTH